MGRWKREAIDKQIRTAAGAKNYVERCRNQIYLDAKCTKRFPITIPSGEIKVHRIIVAHGAAEACKNFSDKNVYGSLGVSYGQLPRTISFPFIVGLDKTDPAHLFDSHNLEIVLTELDTFYDFEAYLKAKEHAIAKLDSLIYCGEEDLLAHYLYNFNSDTKSHRIGLKTEDYNGVMIEEGEWQDFAKSAPYLRKKEADRISYMWDELIQLTCQNALDGRLLGDGDVFKGRSAIHEMAKESRLSRRALSELMTKTIENFPSNPTGIFRQLSFFPSQYENRGYVFFQLWHPNIVDYDNNYRPVRRKMLEVACGAAKNKFPNLKQVIGIAIEPPKLCSNITEDFILMDCEHWTPSLAAHYTEENKLFNFFETKEMKMRTFHVSQFPLPKTGTQETSRE